MTFYWHDYETWGIDPRYTRPSQFAGIRTDEHFEIVGEPLVAYCQPNEDFLPDPYAVFVTGITPQKAKAEGLPEHEFAKKIHAEFSTPQTVGIGYNSINFDDEFTRYLFWRNFYDPYAHTYQDGNSRWDLVNVVRLMRALRPDGLQWPVIDGRPSNRLEHLTKANGIEHADAHDALSDVLATIELAKIMKKAQPKLFEFVFTHRDKKSAAGLLNIDTVTPVVHSSDKFRSETLGTALVAPFAMHPNGRDVMTWNLKFDPARLLDESPESLREVLFMNRHELTKSKQTRPALKSIRLNRCPVLAPASTLDSPSAERIQVDIGVAKKYQQWMVKHKPQLEKVVAEIFEGESDMPTQADPDAALYNGFTSDIDRKILMRVPRTKPEELLQLQSEFSDQRLSKLLFRYRARNFPHSLNTDERAEWESHRNKKLLSENAPHMTFKKYGTVLQKLLQESHNDPAKQHLLEQLQLWGESLYPVDI